MLYKRLLSPKFALTNTVEKIDGLVYIDIDALLKDSGYSYYRKGEWYWVKKTDDVVEDVVADEASGLQELIPSADIIGSEAYRAEVAEDEAMIMLSTDEEGSWYYTVLH